MTDLLNRKHCVPCEGDSVPLFQQDAENLLKQVPKWMLWPDGKTIARAFAFKNFAEAMTFANKVGDLAEVEGHHPDLLIGWGRVEIELSTHAIGGLSENDFILAAKIDQL
jgi:4a-hydroxytetrahydrobiopterin dehydratase